MRFEFAQAPSTDQQISWLRLEAGIFVGLLTDPPGTAFGSVPVSQDMTRHHHLSLAQKLVSQDENLWLGSSQFFDPERLFQTLWTETFVTNLVMVDDRNVQVHLLCHEDLQFVFGIDLEAYPFGMVRPLKLADDPWPVLTLRQEH